LYWTFITIKAILTDIAKELKMSPNQIRDSKEAQREEQCQSKQKEELSLSSKAYKYTQKVKVAWK
jgi:hypothetical protein